MSLPLRLMGEGLTLACVFMCKEWGIACVFMGEGWGIACVFMGGG